MVFSMTGAILVAIPASIVIPRLITWYFEPPVKTGCSCVESIAWALNANRWAELAALLLGAVMGLILAIKTRSIKQQ
ncbi:MAG: hypothetical protein EBX52_09575 [Proteobacteria bacterium]|nr:hypothetical protein [Pseudomonadota bacterium]